MLFKLSYIKVIMHLKEEAESVADLAERASVSYPTTLKVLETLEKLGICKLEKDGNKKRVSLTDKGRWLRSVIIRIFQKP